MNLEKTGALIASTRHKKNLTQRELAELLHVTDRAVSKWERGLSFPDVSLLVPITDILGLTLTELLNGELSQQDADSDERPLHEIIALSKAALRERTVKLRLLAVIVSILLIILCSIGAVRLWNDPDHRGHVISLKSIPLSQKELTLMQISNAMVGRYRYTLTDDIQTVRAVYEVWTEDGLVDERVLWRRNASEFPLNYRGSFIYSVNLGQAFAYDGMNNDSPAIHISWSLPSSVIVGQEIPLPHEASGMVFTTSCPNQRRIEKDSTLLYMAEFTGKDSYTPAESEAIEEFTANAIRGEAPMVSPGEYTVFVWLEVGHQDK